MAMSSLLERCIAGACLWNEVGAGSTDSDIDLLLVLPHPTSLCDNPSLPSPTQFLVHQEPYIVCEESTPLFPSCRAGIQGKHRMREDPAEDYSPRAPAS